MLKLVHPEVWVFDVEWVPDAESGRRVYGLPDSLDDDEVVERMWKEGGATQANPRPYLKTVLCRVVSIAAVVRRCTGADEVSLKLRSLPSPDAANATEAEIIYKFLSALGRAKPQLVGFASQSSDLVILVQRALAHRLHLPDFCKRPIKPWDGVDYFARGSDFNIDLKDVFGGWGKATPSLHELASVCCIPGKLGVEGRDVVDLWRAANVQRILQYNQCDALSTYLLWLRAAFMAGHLDQDAFHREESQLETSLEREAEDPNNLHLREYVDAWRSLRTGDAARRISTMQPPAMAA